VIAGQRPYWRQLKSRSLAGRAQSFCNNRNTVWTHAEELNAQLLGSFGEKEVKATREGA
jgi:hypothetical protein